MKNVLQKNLMIILMAFMFIVFVPFIGMPLTAKAAPKAHTVHSSYDKNGSSHQGWTAISNEADLRKLETNGGSGYLTADIKLTQQTPFHVSSGKEVNLCLNGHEIIQPYSISVIFVDDNGKLNLYDQNCDLGKITHAKDVEGIGVDVKSSGTFTLNGGSIAGNKWPYGGGVYVDNAKFIMNGGNIFANRATTSFGGGIYAHSAEVIMNGGTISANNSFSSGGAVYCEAESVFTMNGGTISDNFTVLGDGGAITLYTDSTFTMNGGTISNNSSHYHGGAIYSNASTIVLKDGKFEGNKAECFGGAISTYEGKLTIEDGLFSENTSINGGGALHVDFGTGNITGGSFIGNNTDSSGGAIYAEHATLNITGGNINANNSSVRGGGIDVLNSTFVMKGGTISQNTAPLGAGMAVSQNNYDYPGDFSIEGGIIKDNKAQDWADGIYIYAEGLITDGIVKDSILVDNSDYGSVKFLPNNGSGKAYTQYYYKNLDRVLVKNKFTRSGYIFTGWNTKADGTGKTYKAGAKITDSTPEKLYAQWGKVTTYTVNHYKQKIDGTYNSSPSETETIEEASGTTVKPAVKTYTGFTSPEVKSVKVKEDGSTVVKYYYERKSYKLIWDLDGGSADGSYTTGNVKYGDKIVAPVPYKKDYVFVKWSVDVPAKMPAKKLTVKATWRKATDADYVTVKFDANNGTITEGSSKKKLQKGYKFDTLPKATREGYFFLGWFTSKTGGTEVTASTIVEKSMTLYAHWKVPSKITYKVEHYKQNTDGTYPSKANKTESFKCLEGESVTPAVLSFTGFKSPSTQTVTVVKNGEVVVKYKYSRKKYKLTWDFDGGTASGSYTKGSVMYGTKIKAPVPEKAGYEFTGWDATVPTTMPAKAVTRKATWRKLSKKENVQKFVERFYTIILDRPAEPAGLNDWTSRLINKEATGSQVAAGFINSDEFQKKKMSDDAYVKKLYKAFFNREPDTSGYNYWMNRLKSGASRDDVLRGFINSAEFNNLCKQYGINAGSY